VEGISGWEQHRTEDYQAYGVAPDSPICRQRDCRTRRLRRQIGESGPTPYAFGGAT
jgi:hypothetical protein